MTDRAPPPQSPPVLPALTTILPVTTPPSFPFSLEESLLLPATEVVERTSSVAHTVDICLLVFVIALGRKGLHRVGSFPFREELGFLLLAFADGFWRQAVATRLLFQALHARVFSGLRLCLGGCVALRLGCRNAGGQGCLCWLVGLDKLVVVHHLGCFANGMVGIA